MNYTIMYLTDVAGNQVLDLSKSGNQYVVGLYSNEQHESRCKKFESKEDAVKCFIEGSTMIANGVYSFNDRCNILFGEN